MQSGKELSLTSQSRNNKPGSAKPKQAICNGFILSLSVCFDIGTSQTNVPTDACFYAPIHLYVPNTLLIRVLFAEQECFTS